MENLKKIVFAPQDLIDQYEKTAVEFFKNILDMDYHECLVADESHLSDFTLCGLTEEESEIVTNSEHYATEWDKIILNKINSIYGLGLEKTVINLTDIFALIEKTINQTKH